MKHLNLLVKLAILGTLGAVLFSGCGSSTGGGGEVSAGAVEIPADKNTITFAVNSGQYSDVAFTHKTHSLQYMNDDCISCHAHSGVRDNTIWNCDECHTADATGPDDQNCSDPNEPDHACWMVQCENCHTTLTPNPAPDCLDCHATVNGGSFIDSAVEGLFFFTSTRRGLTDPNGAFSYQPGEQAITFSVGDITLGTGIPKSFMTPINLVPGAGDETNQTVTNIARLLQTLDEDGDHSNGIKIPISVFQYAQNRSINFNVDPNNFDTSNPDLVNFLADLNSAGVFTNGNHTLIDAATAQSNLRTSLDSLSSGCRITAIQSSPIAVTGAYEPNVGQSFTYQWYRADDAAGTNEAPISGATSATYRPVPGTPTGDDGKYLALDVIFDGSSHRCKPVVPDSLTNSVTVYATINSSEDVDKYVMQLTVNADTIIDVESWEAGGIGHGCGQRDFFGNGDSNDYLTTNIFLFEADGTVIDSRVGSLPFYEWRDVWDCRSKRNPILIYSNIAGFPPPAGPPLAIGEYILAVGADLLSQNDAWSGYNTDGSSFSISYTNYRITYTFTQ